MICKCCGVEAPTKYVEFHQNIGALFVRYHRQVKGNLCKSCINKYFWRFTLINLTLGWWGVVSFFLTPFLILNNLIRYLRTLKLQSVAINAQTGGKRLTNSMSKFDMPKCSQISGLNPEPSRLSVRERDRSWFNTEDDRPSLPQESEPSSDSSIADLIKHLGCSNNSEFRCLAAEQLGQRGSTATPAISALLIACVDVDATVRKAALNALELIDPGWSQNSEAQKAFPKLTEEFKHSYCFKKSYSEDVSKAAYKLLRQIGKPAVSSLANLIVEKDDKIEYKICAIWILKDIGSDAADAVPQLIQALSNKASQVRIAAAEALANFRSAAKDATSELIIGLADRDSDVRKAMATCLVATEPAVSDLLPLLADKNPNVREAVTDILVQSGPQTIPALSEIVSQWYTKSKADTDNAEQDQKIAETALQVMGKFGSDALVTVPTIALALVDSNSNIRVAAIQALRNINRNWVSDTRVVDAITSLAGVEAAILRLIDGLADRNSDVRKALVTCLAQFGATAKPAVPHLQRLRTDLDSEVRKAASDALMQIDPKPEPTVIEKDAVPPERDTGGNFFKPKPSIASPTSHVSPQTSSRLDSLKRQLLTLLQGDSQACQRLIEQKRRENPQRKEDELYETVIYQLVKDRR